MSHTPTSVGSAKSLLANETSDKEVYVTEPQPMIINGKDTGIKYSSVFEPSTGNTYIVERTYVAGFALQKADIQNNTIATVEKDGTWSPTDRTDNATKAALQNDPQLSQSFTDTVNKSITRAYAQQNNGQKLSPAKLAEIKQGTEATSTGGGDANGGGGDGDGDGANGGGGDGDGNNRGDNKDSPDPDQKLTQEAIKKSSEELTEIFDITTQLSANIQAKRAAFSAEDLKYPENFPEKTDYIEFIAKTYGTKTFSKDTFGFSARKNEVIKKEGSVKLPIQPSISDSNSVGWNEQTINPAQVVGAGAAMGGIAGGIQGFGNAIDQTIKNSRNNPQAIESAIVAFFTQQATGAQILPKIGGAIFNPNTELLFQGPQLRPFNFTFKLSPRSKKESEIVKKIIRFFKKNMAAATTNSELYLKAPNVFGIKYFLKNDDHPGINLIKDCALQSCTVNYTPEGSYMAYDDGGMTSYELTLQFMELEPIYSSDYDDERAVNHKIGY